MRQQNNQESFVNFLAVTIVFAFVLAHSFNKNRYLIGLNCILLCFGNTSQTTKIESVRENVTQTNLKRLHSISFRRKSSEKIVVEGNIRFRYHQTNSKDRFTKPTHEHIKYIRIVKLGFWSNV